MRRAPSPVDLSTMLAHWIASGIITDEQAGHIRQDMATSPVVTRDVAPAARAMPMVGEALGYLGGIIILVAAGLITGHYWANLGTGARLGLVAGVTFLLLAAGAAIPRRLGAPGARLRAVLWLASSAALSGMLALIGAEVLSWQGEAVSSFAAAGAAAYCSILWFAHRHVVMHTAFLIYLVAAAGMGISLLPDPGFLPGLAVWGVGAAWFTLAWGTVVRPRQPGLILGAVAAVFGALTTMSENWGTILGLLTVAVLVVLAVAFHDLVLLAVSSVGTLIVLPTTMARYFSGALAAALALLGVGVVLVVAAILTTRRRTAAPAGWTARAWDRGTPLVSIAIAGVIAGATTAAILAAGLTG